MFNIRGRITSKLIELPFNWLYGSRKAAKSRFEEFRLNSPYSSNDELLLAFINAEFWKAFLGLKQGEPFRISALISASKNLVNQKELLSKITNHQQL